MASPTVQEQVNTFAERVDVDFQNQMKSVTQKMEMMQAGDPNFQVQAKHLQEQMKAILAKSVTDQMGALSADPGFQEQAKLFAEGMQNSNDKMVDKMLDRGLMASSFEHAHLDNAVFGKPSSMQNSNDKMVDKMVDQGLMTSSFERAHLDNAVFGPAGHSGSYADQKGALSADPGFQEQAKWVAEGMQNSNDKMVDKILDRSLMTSSFERA